MEHETVEMVFGDRFAGGRPGRRLLGRAGKTDDANRKAGRRERQGTASGRGAIRKQARNFVQAFAKGDAKAIAAQWTENAIYRNETGEVVRGRTALEKEFAEFFKEHPKCQIEVRIESITFLCRAATV